MCVRACIRACVHDCVSACVCIYVHDNSRIIQLYVFKNGRCVGRLSIIILFSLDPYIDITKSRNKQRIPFGRIVIPSFTNFYLQSVLVCIMKYHMAGDVCQTGKVLTPPKCATKQLASRYYFLWHKFGRCGSLHFDDIIPKLLLLPHVVGNLN